MKVIIFIGLFVVTFFDIIACNNISYNMKQDTVKKMSVSPVGFIDGLPEYASLVPDPKEFFIYFDEKLNKDSITLAIEKHTNKPFTGTIEIYDTDKHLVAEYEYRETDKRNVKEWCRFIFGKLTKIILPTL